MRIGDVTISKGLERESSYFWVTRPEQVVINLAEGKTFVSDSGRGLLQGVLTVRNLTGPKAYEVLDYVARVLKLQSYRCIRSQA